MSAVRMMSEVFRNLIEDPDMEVEGNRRGKLMLMGTAIGEESVLAMDVLVG